MKFTTIITPLVLCASLVSAAKKPKLPKFGGGEEESAQAQDDQAQNTQSGFFAQATATGPRNVGEVISSFYPTQVPTLAPAVSTTLASSLLSVESAWFASPEQTKADEAIMSAAPIATSILFAQNGYVYGEITSQNWYRTGVPKSLQSEVASYVSAIESVHEKYVSTATARTTAGGSVPTRVAGSGALKTQAPMMVAGAMVGAVVVAVL